MYDALPLALKFEKLRLVYCELRPQFEALGFFLGNKLEEIGMPLKKRNFFFFVACYYDK
jgi:hypothetical protein